MESKKSSAQEPIALVKPSLPGERLAAVDGRLRDPVADRLIGTAELTRLARPRSIATRRIVGWSIGERMTGDLVLGALHMAIALRKPTDVIHHSDQGSQYTALAFGSRCNTMGVRPSMGTVGDAYDNAMAESFFASLECELIDRRSFKTKTKARHALFTYIAG